MLLFRGLLSSVNEEDVTRIVSDNHEGPRKWYICPHTDQSYVHLHPDLIYEKFSIEFEDVTYIHHMETNARIQIPRIGVMLPKGGTYIVKTTPPPRSKRSRIIWTCLLLAILGLATLAYNQTTFSADWNSDAPDRTMGERFRQGAALALALPVYFFPWDEIIFLRSRYVRLIVVWILGYVMHPLIVLYYVITIFWREVPLPPVVIDNALFVYSVAVTIITVWLD